MRRRFKSKRKKNFSFISWIILLISVLLTTKVIFKYFKIENIVNKKYVIYKVNPNKILLNKGLNYKYDITTTKKDEYTFKEEVTTTTKKVIKPKIYIYNTHQTEEYKDYNVYDASKYLKKVLEKQGVDVILETTNIKNALNKNNLQYKDSYKITRNLLEQKISDNISLYIDLHRDSIKYTLSTTTYNNKKVAKILFVIGAKHNSYKDNYNVVKELNKMLKNIEPNLSRGIFVRKSSSYNQDLDKRVILIELGGNKNNKEEVNNAIEHLSSVLSNYVKI